LVFPCSKTMKTNINVFRKEFSQFEIELTIIFCLIKF
jgi:hypothetical protein